MSVPATGQVSFSNLQSVFGGTNPISLSEYYNNAPLVAARWTIGIPNIGSAISMSNLRGKSSSAPQALQTNKPANPFGVGSTVDEIISDFTARNVSRSGGSIIPSRVQNLRASNNINYQSLILQARPGDIVNFIVKLRVVGGYTEHTAIYINLSGGTSWTQLSVVRTTSSNGENRTPINMNYTIPTNLARGNYGIYIYNFYNSVGSTSYTSARFYSLHIV